MLEYCFGFDQTANPIYKRQSVLPELQPKLLFRLLGARCILQRMCLSSQFVLSQTNNSSKAMSALREEFEMLIIQCEECKNISGCIDEKSNKMEVCDCCSDQNFCLASIEEIKRVVRGICPTCSEKLYSEVYA